LIVFNHPDYGNRVNAVIMEKRKERYVNIEPIEKFLNEYISPTELAELIDELFYEYLSVLVKSAEDGRVIIHEDMQGFIYYMKLLRDVLRQCEK